MNTLTLFISSLLLKSLETIQRLDLIILTFHVLMHSNVALFPDARRHCPLQFKWGPCDEHSSAYASSSNRKLIEKCKENSIDLLIMQQSPSI